MSSEKDDDQTMNAEDEKVQEQPQDNGSDSQDAPEDHGAQESLSSADIIAKNIEDMGLTEKTEPESDLDPKNDEDAPEDAGQDASQQQKQPAEKPEKTPAGDKPQETQQAKKTEAEEEAELLDGVKSERGRQRLQKLLSDGRGYRTQLQQMRQTIAKAGLDPESFGNLLEISRLCNSNSQDDITRGLQMLENVRGTLYRALGREAPGIDLLNGFDDLQEKVKSMSMNREDALLIAQARRAQQAEKERYQQQREVSRHTRDLQDRCQAFGRQVMDTFSARSKELDFQAKIEKMQAYFRQPGAMERFVKSHPPETWQEALLFMYDNIGAQQQAHQSSQPGPLTQRRARSTGVRVPASAPGSAESIMAHIEEMGI